MVNSRCRERCLSCGVVVDRNHIMHILNGNLRMMVANTNGVSVTGLMGNHPFLDAKILWFSVKHIAPAICRNPYPIRHKITTWYGGTLFLKVPD